MLMLEVLYVPDGGAPNAADRLHIAGLYRGIPAAAPPSGFVPYPRPRGARGGLSDNAGGLH